MEEIVTKYNTGYEFKISWVCNDWRKLKIPHFCIFLGIKCLGIYQSVRAHSSTYQDIEGD